jgi:hypothetical protein
MSKRPLTRCRVCGGTHTPKCRPPSKRMDADIWRGILAEWKAEKADKKAKETA